MSEQSAVRKHKVLDHPILSYFLLLILAMIMLNIGSNVIDNALAKVIPEYSSNGNTGSGIGIAIGALAAAFIFKAIFRKEYPMFLSTKNFVKGMILMAPFLIIHWAGSITSWVQFGTAGSAYALLICLMRGTAPGFGEEIAFRGLGVSNFMRVIKSEKQIPVIFWLSSVVFGASHMFNAFAGAALSLSIIQSVYAIGVGMLFVAVYLRTGSIWPTILGHTLVDAFEFFRGDMYLSNGIMVNMGVGDWITIVAGTLAAVLGLILVNKKHYSEIMTVWAEKWNKA